MDKTLFTPHIERLESILREMKNLETRKREVLLSFRKHFIEYLMDKIQKCDGQKFAFTISGEYKKTLAFGPPGKNHETTVPFDITYVGKIRSPNWGFLDFKPEYDYLFISASALEIPFEKMYIMDLSKRELKNPGFVKAEPEDKLFIWKVGRQEPSWHIHNLMKKYVSEDVYKSILVYPQWACDLDTQVELFIGDEEYKEFVKTRSKFIDNILPI